MIPDHYKYGVVSADRSTGAFVDDEPYTQYLFAVYDPPVSIPIQFIGIIPKSMDTIDAKESYNEKELIKIFEPYRKRYWNLIDCKYLKQ